LKVCCPVQVGTIATLSAGVESERIPAVEVPAVEVSATWLVGPERVPRPLPGGAAYAPSARRKFSVPPALEGTTPGFVPANVLIVRVNVPPEFVSGTFDICTAAVPAPVAVPLTLMSEPVPPPGGTAYAPSARRKLSVPPALEGTTPGFVPANVLMDSVRVPLVVIGEPVIVTAALPGPIDVPATLVTEPPPPPVPEGKAMPSRLMIATTALLNVWLFGERFGSNEKPAVANAVPNDVGALFATARA
jgi:hypothetical protein